MKKKILVFVAVATLSIGGIFTFNSAQATINPDCINGCVRGSGGCKCNGDYPSLKEHSQPAKSLR